MNAIAAPKSRAQNCLEGIALTAIFQVLPTFAAAAMLLFKLAGHEIAGRAMLFVVLALTFYAARALAPAEVSKILQKRLRAVVLRRESAGRRKAREMAGAAGSIAAVHDDGADAVVAGGGAGERGVIFRAVIPGRRGGESRIHNHDLVRMYPGSLTRS